MKRSIFLGLYLALAYTISAQKHDYIWLFGYGGGSQSPLDSLFGMNVFDFNPEGGPLIHGDQEIEANFGSTNAIFCDSAGALLFYTNGEKIFNHQHEVMENGSNISTTGNGYGYFLPQGAVILPDPDLPDHYFIFHSEDFYPTGAPYVWRLYQSVVDMSQNNGLGKVMIKRQVIIQDTLDFGQITATKHANGRDWWILVKEWNTNRFHRLLLSPAGIELGLTAGTDTIMDGVGQAIFSPDGTRYVRVRSNMTNEPYRIDVYDFDRCSGELSNQRSTYGALNGGGKGVAISPDSRYMYVIYFTIVFQYDLQADDIFPPRQ